MDYFAYTYEYNGSLRQLFILREAFEESDGGVYDFIAAPQMEIENLTVDGIITIEDNGISLPDYFEG